MRSFKPMLLAVAGILSPLLIPAQPNLRAVDSLMQKYAAYNQFSGAVLISKNGEVVFARGYGYASFEDKIPNSPHTKFGIGSVTKTFTDVLILQQVEKGTIRLEGKITDYLPEYPRPNGDSITIYQLMTHRSGLPDYDASPLVDIDYSRHYTHLAMLALFDSLPLEFTPGTRFQYSNSGAFVLGMILERVMGQSYRQLLQDSILGPLHMDSSGCPDSGYFRPFCATDYDCYSARPSPSKGMDLSIAFSAGAMYSTVEDLEKWNAALYTGKLLSKKYLQIYFTPDRSVWACDWMILTNPFRNAPPDTRVTLRAGSQVRFLCFDTRFMDEKGSIILMCNTASSRMEEITKKLTGLYFGAPARPPKLSLQRGLIESAGTIGLPSALHKIRALAKDTARYYVSAAEFLHLAFWYKYEARDLKSAILVFQLISDLFPGTYNAYDSELFANTSNVYALLGAALAEDGQKEKAAASFRKALELDPP